MRDFLALPEQRPPLLSRIPRWASWFLGFRAPDAPKQASPEWAQLLNTLLATYAALLVQAAINKYGYPFKQWKTPELVPSFGASAVLVFNAIASPLAQPRNLVLGSMVGTLVGVALAKFWMEHQSNEQYLWLGAPLACAVSSVLASILKCVHPPAGATAMLPFLDTAVRDLGWKYFVVELQGCAVFLACACLFDNITARYPTHWWTPPPAPKAQQPPPPSIEITADGVKSTLELDDETHRLIKLIQNRL